MSRRAPVESAILCFQTAGDLRVFHAEGLTSELLGYSPQQLLSNSIDIRQRIHPEDADLRALLFEETSVDGGSMCLRIRHADEKMRCLDVRFERRENLDLRLELRHPAADSRINGSSGSRAMLLANENGAFFKDRNHVYTAANPSFLRTMAPFLNGRDLAGLTDYDLLPEAEADQYYRTEKQVLQSGTAAQQVYAVARAGAPGAWIHARIQPVRNLRGPVEGLFVTLQNLTAGIYGEAREEVAVDPVTGESLRPEMGTYILDIRKAAFATSANLDLIFGLGKDQPRDMATWQGLIHPEDREPVLRYFGEVIATPGRIFNREYRILRAGDRQLRWVHGIGRVVRDEAGEPILMRGSVQDITARRQTEAALRETKERLQIFIEHAPAALAMFDREMRYIAASRRWQETYRLEDQTLAGLRHYDLVPDLPERWKAIHRRALAGEALRCDEDKFERADGTIIWVRWEILPWHAEDGSVGGISIFLENITAAKEAEGRLQLAVTLFDQASEAIAVTDLNGAILRINESFTQLLGYTAAEVIGQHIEFLKSPDGGESFYSLMSGAVARYGRWRGELRNRAKDGHEVPVACTITTVRDSSGQPKYYVCMFFDISPIKDHERRLEHMIRYDALTGLPNRLQFTELLRHQIAEAQSAGKGLALVAVDLDRFKTVNDLHGKAIADSLLMNVASRMKQVLRDGDILGRPGGDEFVVILRDVAGPQAAQPILQQLFRAIAEPLETGAEPVQVSATGGVAFYPQEEDVDADQLWRRADQALYEAKLAGRNRFLFFDAARDSSRRGREDRLEEIRQAIGRGEFVLHYQPKVNLATGEMIGAEALVRWQHPRHGLQPPSAFLPEIEEHELGIALGEWVIDAALTQIERWSEAGHNIRVSVNVSPHHLQQPAFLDRLKALLAAHPSVDPALLALEVLETSMLRDVEHVSRIIQSCGAMGIRVAIDDFGTGYSALTYLKRLPAQVLKVDQSFVRGMLEYPDDLAIVQSVLGLANAFRRMVVAEGVETVEHGVLLLMLGCTFAQGYGIARPMPAADLLRWSAAWQLPVSWKQVRALSPLDWPLLAAQVEMRSWDREFQAHMAGVSGAAPPELDETVCRFRSILDAERMGPRGGHPALARLDSVHSQAHRAAREAVTQRKRGNTPVALRWMQETLRLRRQMQEQIDLLLWGPMTGASAFDALRSGAGEIVAKLQ